MTYKMVRASGARPKVDRSGPETTTASGFDSTALNVRIGRRNGHVLIDHSHPAPSPSDNGAATAGGTPSV